MHAKQFKQLRESMMLTQVELSDKIGLSQSYISNIEREIITIQKQTELAMLYLIERYEQNALRLKR